MSPKMQVLYTCHEKEQVLLGERFYISQSNHIIQAFVYTYLANCKLIVLVLYDVGFLTEKHLYLIEAITEHAVCCQSNCHLHSNNIASKSTRLRKGLSCETQFVSTVLELEYIIDQRKKTHVVFPDFSNIFYKISYRNFSTKFSTTGSANFASQGHCTTPGRSSP